MKSAGQIISRSKRRSSSVTTKVDKYMNRPIRHRASTAEATGPRASAQLGRWTSLAVAAAHAWCRRLSDVRCPQTQLA